MMTAEKELAVDCQIWEPRKTAVVLGRSCQLENEVDVSQCSADGVSIEQRLGGGCAVVIAPGMIIVSVMYRQCPGSAIDHLRWWTEPVIQTLRKLNIRELSFRGTSDLCIADRKIMGSCLYRAKESYLFQASLLATCELDFIERYLKMPPRMPAYREGRPHRSFLTSLAEAGYSVTCSDLVTNLTEAFQSFS
jgi:lipoate-protein ligase A